MVMLFADKVELTIFTFDLMIPENSQIHLFLFKSLV